MRLLQTLALICTTILTARCGAVTEELPTYDETSIIVVGDQAPDFTATTLSGEEFTLSECRGEVVLLILFSHTCPDCKALFDDVKSYGQELESLGIELIAVSRGGETKEVEAFATDNGYSFDIVADSTAEIYYKYAEMYVPRTYVIDGEGVVRYTTVEYGATHLRDIISEIESLNE